MHREVTKLVADGFYREALTLFTKHHSASFKPNKFTFPCLFKACGKLKSIVDGEMLHTQLIKTGFVADVFAATAVTDMYMKVNLPGNALKMFGEMPEPNLPSLNATISGFCRNGYCGEALRMFRQVGVCSRLRPNSVTVASLLNACENLADGSQVHCWAVKLGFEDEVYVGTALTTMYSGCAEMVSATKVFGTIHCKNVVSYNAYISGLLQNDLPHMVLEAFKDMKAYCSELPNTVTYASVLSACSTLLYLQFGRQVHGHVAKTDMGFDTMVGTALVDMYSKCSKWKWAYVVFQELNGQRNLITWNSMIAGMVLNGQSENAIELFTELELGGPKPDSATWNSMISGFMKMGKHAEAFIFFKKMMKSCELPSMKSITSLLPVCSALFALRSGKEIHGHTIRTDIYRDEFVCTATVDMYMKCGLSSWAQRTFNHLERKSDDPAIWNAMISGYGKNGETESAFNIFNQMIEEGVKPNKATFSCILSLCSHTGQVEKGWQLFKTINRNFGLCPTEEHLNCIVDLLGRSGWLEEARVLLKEMPNPSASVLASLLNASVLHSDFIKAEEFAMMLSELEPESPTPFVILSNTYAAQGRWEDAERVRKMMDDRELRKMPGLSSVGVT